MNWYIDLLIVKRDLSSLRVPSPATLELSRFFRSFAPAYKALCFLPAAGVRLIPAADAEEITMLEGHCGADPGVARFQ